MSRHGLLMVLGQTFDLVFSMHGKVVLTSMKARPWLERRELMARLADAVRLFSRDDIEERAIHFGSVHVTLVRLQGESDRGRRVLARIEQRGETSVLKSLSRRQREVAELAASGATVDDIARFLRISRETARSHLADAYRKLGVRRRVDLVGLLTASRLARSNPT